MAEFIALVAEGKISSKAGDESLKLLAF